MYIYQGYVYFTIYIIYAILWIIFDKIHAHEKKKQKKYIYVRRIL